MAVEKENIEIIKLLLANDKLDVNLLCKIEEKEKERTIIEMSPLHLAIDNKQDIIIEIFLSQKKQNQIKKIDVNKRSIKKVIGQEIEVFEKTSLYMSIEKRDMCAIKALLASTDIDVNDKSFHSLGNKIIEEKTALHLAVEIDDIEIVKLLLEKNDIDINIEDLEGRKPIDYSSNDEIKQLLSQ